MTEKIGLICEGGGTKAAYTYGILQCFLDHDIEFLYTVRINAGAEALLPSAVKQKDRLRVIGVDAACEPGVIGVSPLIHEKGVLGTGYVCKFVEKRAPLDYETFVNNKALLDIGVHNMGTNEVKYFPKEYFDLEKQILMQTSCALFLPTRPYKFRGHTYIDVGLVSMTPIEQSVRQGDTRHVFISTEEENYAHKSAPRWQIQLAKLMYLRNKTIHEGLKVRHINYQGQWQVVEELEEQGNAIVFRPDADYGVTRYAYDRELLGRWLDLGYENIKNHLDMIRELMEKQADCSAFFIYFH